MTTEPTGANCGKSRLIRQSLWLVSMVLAVYLGSWGRLQWIGLQDHGQRGQAMVGCFSDSFGPLEVQLLKYAGTNNGQFPSWDQLAASFPDKEKRFFLTCSGNKQPLGWNPSLQTISTNSSETRLLAWCPTGAHGEYSGVILFTNGQLKSALVKAGQLAGMMERELKLLSVEAKSR